MSIDVSIDVRRQEAGDAAASVSNTVRAHVQGSRAKQVRQHIPGPGWRVPRVFGPAPNFRRCRFLNAERFAVRGLP